jgi:acetolactate synthase-1/2/3 large subunit
MTAGRALVIAGLGARGADDTAAIRAFCASRRIPAMVTYKAKGVIGDADASFAGIFTNGLIEGDIVDQADLLIAVGLDPVELLPRPWTRTVPIVAWGRWRVAEGHVKFSKQIVGEIGTALDSIGRELGPSRWDLDDVRRRVDAQRARIRLPSEQLTADRVVDVVAKRAAATARVTVDAGAHMLPATMLWPVDEPNRMLISNGLSTMGFALPAAIGAALVDRDRPTVALTGDGGLLICAGELLTAVRERLRIITLVFSDASLSLIEIKQQARQLPAAGVALGAIDWISLARGFGVQAWTADDEAALDRAIDAALLVDGPTLIEAKIDRHNYGATLRAVRG